MNESAPAPEAVMMDLSATPLTELRPSLGERRPGGLLDDATRAVVVDLARSAQELWAVDDDSTPPALLVDELLGLDPPPRV
jgi:hypothetical protein